MQSLITNLKYEITNLKYEEFDDLFLKQKIPLNSDYNFSTYINWFKVSKSYQIGYESIAVYELIKLFENSIICKLDVELYIRLSFSNPLIKVKANNLSNHIFELLDLVHGMGWEAISLDGKYFFEFTDDADCMFISNFEIQHANENIYDYNYWRKPLP